MATISARTKGLGAKHYLEIDLPNDAVQIPLSEDNATAVKKAFNRLIERAREGEFAIELESVGDDLFSQVANEYVRQLNKEIQEVHAEMRKYGLLMAARKNAKQ